MGETSEIVVHLDRSGGTIHPHLHGHFAEQLAGCINGGFWDAANHD